MCMLAAGIKDVREWNEFYFVRGFIEESDVPPIAEKRPIILSLRI